jgi:magnesium-transporting ATPase (P-type)
LSTFYLIWYAGVKPHIDKRRIKIEVFNEFMIMIFIYHLLLFTDYCINNAMQFAMGYSFVCGLVVIVFFNLALMIVKTVERSARKRKLDKLRLA